MIARFFDPINGGIFLDGINIKNLCVEALRSQIALVSQEIGLFDLSVADNIAYGVSPSNYHTITHEKIEHAAKLAAAHDFIMALPNGYQTMLGENGLKLSGGQRQRIAIARAVIKDAPILLLDEATSALDSESERVVQEALNHMQNRCTTIIVAHRLSTITHASTIHVLDHGRIVESGNHQELIELKGIYDKLWSKQSNKHSVS
jgi:subfamily B ATP-binding cassette protein MsbA